MASRSRPTSPARRPTSGTTDADRRPPGDDQTAGGGSARVRLAAERARQQQRRRRLLVVAVPVAVVLVAVVSLVVVRLTTGSSTSAAAPAGPVDDAVGTVVTSVPAAVLDQVGAGQGTTPPVPVQAPALTSGGKPKVLYVGAEYCPYCAAERWAMVVAASRFGTFSGLGQTASAAADVYPSTPTLTFQGAGFTSSTITFTGVETEGNQVVGNGYAPLDTLSEEDQQTFSTYNQPPYVSSAGSIPFVDIGGKYLISGASYSPALLKGKTHAQIATALSDPTSPIAQAVDGTANQITAAICATTANAPTDVCRSPGVTAAAAGLR